MRKPMKTLALGVVMGLGLGVGTATAAQYGPGASDTEVKIGNTNPYSGPASAYGTIGKGLAAYFRMINDQGGVNGRKINFITVDDGYSPPKTVEQVRRLVEQERVLFLFQTLGTPTNSAVYRSLNAKKVPDLFIATGASKWGANPKKYPWVMGWQPTYRTEAKIYAKYVLQNIEDPKVAILYQNDDYGKDYLNGFLEGLGSKAGSVVVAQQPYEVTDPTIDSQIVQFKESGANVFFNVTTPKFAAQAIRKAYDIGWRPLHLLNNVSQSVGSVLRPAGLEASKGLITANYLMDPTDSQWHSHPDYKAWVAWMEKYYPEGDRTNSFNAYAYSVAATMVETLKRAGDNLTRENMLKQATSLKHWRAPMLLPGITITTSPTDYYPIECLQLSRFDGTTWKLFGEVLCAETSGG